MAVFPEQLDRLELGDTESSLKRMESYIRYMTERIEFANTNTMRTVSEAGVSNVGLYKAVITLADTVSVLQANMNLMSGNLATMSNRVADMVEQVEALSGKIDGLQTDVNTVQEGLTALEARVAKLEET